ncbi:MAG: hypothetical protein P4N41_05410 [Negativicutes bacterium]|nr:hypothetical protein [Negativicutes bacterium]
MAKYFLAMLLTGFLLLGQIAPAAAAPEFLQQLDIVADKAVTPLDYSFFDQPSTGRVELYNVKNLWGAGAQMIFYLETGDGTDWLILGFSNSMVEVRLQNRKQVLFSERLTAITASTPLVLIVNDGLLKASIGGRSQTAAGVTAFKGSLTTQSVETTLKAYRFTEQR